jgi:twitching motility protein PilT
MLVEINTILGDALAKGSSDVHIQAGLPLTIRRNGDLIHLYDSESISPDDARMLFESIANEHLLEVYKNKGSVDFSYDLEQLGRFRVSAFHHKGQTVLAMRCIPTKIPTFAELNLPPVIEELADMNRGMILVTGTTGSGKSTTLASIIEHINRKEAHRIITIEDPIEFSLVSKSSFITQQEVGADTSDFAYALRGALRQDPDVIMVGEMRDQETISVGISAAETGHLVMSTLHTGDATQTIERIISFFPLEHQDRVRRMVALNLKAVISQRLLKTKDGTRRVPAIEVLVVTPTVKKLMMQGKLTELYTAIQNRDKGMQTFNQSINDLIKKDFITLEMGMEYADDPAALKRTVRGGESSGDQRSIIGV